MKDILDTIIANKKIEIALLKQSQRKIEIPEDMPVMSMRQSLINSQSGIISEFKRRSPSKLWIAEGADAPSITAGYSAAGAAAISILTDTKFFGGTIDDLRASRKGVNVPILRKDFIIDSYQIHEAKSAGANAILLIAAALSTGQCSELCQEAHALGVEVLLEIHSESELKYITDDIDMVGVNNRNLGTFHTDIDNSFRIAQMLPKDKVLVSESGISSPEAICLLRKVGFKGFLIGESFMKTENPTSELKHFIEQI